MPLLRTKMIPESTVRSGIRVLPPLASGGLAPKVGFALKVQSLNQNYERLLGGGSLFGRFAVFQPLHGDTCPPQPGVHAGHRLHPDVLRERAPEKHSVEEYEAVGTR